MTLPSMAGCPMSGARADDSREHGATGTAGKFSSPVFDDRHLSSAEAGEAGDAPLHPYLVIVRAGPASLHERWLSPHEGRDFDVLVSAYDRSVPVSTMPGVFHEFRPGHKVRGQADLLDEKRDWLRRYRYVALFDDDLAFDSRDLTRCFRTAESHGLKIAQPALTHDSHFSYAAFLQNKAFELRYVNYIEMMCPIFRVDVLEHVAPLFGLGLESGIDLVWCNVGTPGPRDFAVIDSVAIRHTRPVGGAREANGFSGASRYEDHIDRILGQFGLPWLSCVPYAALTRSGRTVRFGDRGGRLRFLASALGIGLSVPRQADWRARARSVLVHWKHLMLKKPVNLPVALSAPVGRRGVSPLRSVERSDAVG